MSDAYDADQHCNNMDETGICRNTNCAAAYCASQTDKHKAQRNGARPSNWRTRDCTNFQSGYCKYGDTCRFKHTESATPNSSAASAAVSVPHSVPIKGGASSRTWSSSAVPPVPPAAAGSDNKSTATPKPLTFSTTSPPPPPGIGSTVAALAAAAAAAGIASPMYSHQMPQMPQQQQQQQHIQLKPQFVGQSQMPPQMISPMIGPMMPQMIPPHIMAQMGTQMGTYYMQQPPLKLYCSLCLQSTVFREFFSTRTFHECPDHKTKNCFVCWTVDIERKVVHEAGSQSCASK